VSVLQVQTENTQRLSEFDMLERHIMQAQARAVSSDEREAHRLYSAVKDANPEVYIPPGMKLYEVHKHSICSCDLSVLSGTNCNLTKTLSSLIIPASFRVAHLGFCFVDNSNSESSVPDRAVCRWDAVVFLPLSVGLMHVVTCWSAVHNILIIIL
jgi:hypothetical protein